MKAILLMTAGLILAGPGCLHFKPVGPLAGLAAPAADGKNAESPEPILRDAPRPTLPSVYVTPSEITAANAEEAMKRLTQELETDRRTMDAMPRYAEVSVVK
ncbi:hypothetical protein [Limnoglobus roseus]|uniref:Uncharacterized protein n=1 Tax=Limnoglobus roseus TaxID=2598579 RepID=A0A5C1A5I0_9BACT|nr:hypothetical protein [Limnoglobus roseus]QEL13577.1 hypothetical protein PX52LOC_00435 [Limnoglobus roseus]